VTAKIVGRVSLVERGCFHLEEWKVTLVDHGQPDQLLAVVEGHGPRRVAPTRARGKVRSADLQDLVERVRNLVSCLQLGDDGKVVTANTSTTTARVTMDFGPALRCDLEGAVVPAGDGIAALADLIRTRFTPGGPLSGS
jgi:hypothetical protein